MPNVAIECIVVMSAYSIDKTEVTNAQCAPLNYGSQP